MEDEKEIVTIDNQFPSNTNKQLEEKKEEGPVLRKIDPNAGVVKKKNFLDNFMDIASDILKYTLDEVLVPTFKRTASEIIRTASDRAIYGDTAPRRRSSNVWDDWDVTPYNSYYNRDYSYSRRRDDYPITTVDRRRRTRDGLPIISYAYESVAKDYLDNIRDLLEWKHKLTVIDIYDQTKIPGIMNEVDYTWSRYGYEDEPGRDLRGAEIIRISNHEFEVVLPKPVILER